ncbi:MAG TPA: hypothetical protein PKE06_00360 [Flavilitoribacter sp.]|nr:hypothetical protein [Flavilitoribacter sp.]HMQ85967.1 hypothetical protein [Flavilitoribacter sp.]
MISFFDSLDFSGQVIAAVAAVATLFLLAQLIGALFGLGADMDIDADGGVDMPHIDLPILSTQSIAAFLAFGGWTSVLLMTEGYSLGRSLIWSLLAGLAALFAVAWLLYKLSGLAQEHTISMDEALFSKGEVYLAIPGEKSGLGKVHVITKGALREWDAMTEGPALPTGTKIKVTDLLEEALLVEKTL